MKNCIFHPRNGYFVFGKIFRENLALTTLSPRMLQCDKNFSGARASDGDYKKILKTELLKKKENEIAFCPKRLFSSSEKFTKLMDFQIRVGRNIFHSLEVFFFICYSLIKLKVNCYEFMEHSKTALAVVTTLLSESRFSLLEGLLTDNCRAEVERNVKALPPSERIDLAVKVEDIIHYTLCDPKLLKDDNEEKLFMQVTMIYYVVKNCREVFEKSLKGIFEEPCTVIYNARFIKELDAKVECDWWINAINVMKMSEHFTDKKFY